MADKLLGRVGYVYRGDYDAQRQYDKLDTVYESGGTYQCVVPCIGKTPSTSPDYWAQMCASASLTDRKAAETAAAAAKADRQAAETAKADAQAAKGAAVTAKEKAVLAKDTAVTKASEASKSATAAARSAQAARQAAESVDGEALMAAVKGKVSKAGDTMTGALDAPEFKEGGTALTDKYAKKSETLPLTGGVLNGDLKIKKGNSLLLNTVNDVSEPGGIKFYDETGAERFRIFAHLDDGFLLPKFNYGNNQTEGFILTTDTFFLVFDKIRDEFFPVGAIWQSTNPKSPAELLGGTWEAIESGRFLVAAGGDYAVGSKGGEKEHILKSVELPRSINLYYTDGSGSSGIGAISAKVAYLNASTLMNFNVGVKDGGQPHENRPPFYAVYMWRRIA